MVVVFAPGISGVEQPSEPIPVEGSWQHETPTAQTDPAMIHSDWESSSALIQKASFSAPAVYYARSPLASISSSTQPAGGNDEPAPVPMGGRLELSGTLDPDHPSVTLNIPLDAGSQLLVLNLSGPLGDPQGGSQIVPVFGQAGLYGSTGALQLEFDPPNGPGQLPGPSMMAEIRGASPGSHFNVQITAGGGSSELDSSSQSSAGTLASTSPSSSWNVAFTLEIERQDVGNITPSAGSAVGAGPAIGTLVGTVTPQSGASLVSPSESLPVGDNADALPDALETTTAVVSSTPLAADVEPESFDGFDVRVSTGPLASRSASPLGPTLASIDSEATQPVDRHERCSLRRSTVSPTLTKCSRPPGARAAWIGNCPCFREASHDLWSLMTASRSSRFVGVGVFPSRSHRRDMAITVRSPSSGDAPLRSGPGSPAVWPRAGPNRVQAQTRLPTSPSVVPVRLMFRST